MVLGWPADLLEQRFGRRITRAVTRFVQVKLVVLDEAWHLLKHVELPYGMRKFNVGSIDVQQT